MRDTILMLAALGAVIAALGYMNTADIQGCVDRGNSVKVCNYTFNR